MLCHAVQRRLGFAARQCRAVGGASGSGGVDDESPHRRGARLVRARDDPRHGRKPSRWTAIDRDYEQIRITMQKLFEDLAIDRAAA